MKHRDANNRHSLHPLLFVFSLLACDPDEQIVVSASDSNVNGELSQTQGLASEQDRPAPQEKVKDFITSLEDSESFSTIACGNEALRFSDLDGDGTTDIFRADDSKWWVSWSGNGMWSQLNVSAYTTNSLAFADLDGNSTADVFRTDGSNWWVSWSGSGPWSQLNTDSYTLGSLAFGTFDQNAGSDVFRADGSKWWISSGGSSAWSQLNTSGYTLGSLAFADFNGNGMTDVFRADGSKWWVSWSGSGPWSQLNTDSHTLGSLAFGNFDQNAGSDVFRADGTKWYISSGGSGPWVELKTDSNTLGSLVFGNLGGDNKTDVVRCDGVKLWVSISGVGAWTQLDGCPEGSTRNGDGVCECDPNASLGGSCLCGDGMCSQRCQWCGGQLWGCIFDGPPTQCCDWKACSYGADCMYKNDITQCDFICDDPQRMVSAQSQGWTIECN